MLKNRMKNPFNKKIKDQKPQFVNYNSRNEEAIEEEFDEEEAIAEDLIYEKNDQTNISKSPKSWSARLKNIYSKI